MKPFALMLLIGAIVAFSDLVGGVEGSRRAAPRRPLIPAALRGGTTRVQHQPDLPYAGAGGTIRRTL
jgi:hypothetical protein